MLLMRNFFCKCIKNPKQSNGSNAKVSCSYDLISIVCLK